MESPTTNITQRRCVNLDWLEIDCCEPSTGLDANYFRSQGFAVDEREYGTRVFAEMFTILDEHGIPYIEIRRRPKTIILDPRDVHLRLCNRSCYYDDAALRMLHFADRFGYIIMRIVRVDICLDFEKFDRGDDPKRFLLRYLSGKYSKINQANIHGHGRDRWDGRDWNSISWGSPTSDIGTKMYDKTMELYDETSGAYRKPYIRQAWHECGLVDDWQACTKTDADGNTYTPRIWRVEFSIRSSVKNWFVINRDGKAGDKQSIRNNLSMYQDRDRLLVIFASLARHYFRFKYYEEGQRKDRCQDKQLFVWHDTEITYKIAKLATNRKPTKPLTSLLSKIRYYRESHFDKETRQACDLLIKVITDETARIDAGCDFTREEIRALRLALSLKAGGDSTDATILLRNIKALLRLNDDTAPFIDQ